MLSSAKNKMIFDELANIKKHRTTIAPLTIVHTIPVISFEARIDTGFTGSVFVR